MGTDMWLMIDDMRNLGCELEARTAGDGMRMLEEHVGQIECLCLDHDLGENQENGYQIITWALERDLVPPHVQIVSSNPVGRKNIAAALEAAGYATKDGVNFYIVS